MHHVACCRTLKNATDPTTDRCEEHRRISWSLHFLSALGKAKKRRKGEKLISVKEQWTFFFTASRKVCRMFFFFKRYIFADLSRFFWTWSVMWRSHRGSLWASGRWVGLLSPALSPVLSRCSGNDEPEWDFSGYDRRGVLSPQGTRLPQLSPPLAAHWHNHFPLSQPRPSSAHTVPLSG